MSKKKITLRILIGLPGSGKTYFAKSLANNSTTVIHEDELRDTGFRIYNKNTGNRYPPMELDELQRTINLHTGLWVNTLILDGLYLTTERVMEAIKYVSTKFDVSKIILDVWTENKQECIRNDYLRRRIGSSLSIETLSINVNFDTVKQAYPQTTVQTHSVYHTPDWVLFFRQYLSLDDESMLRSNDWVTGGEAWGCGGYDRRPVDPDSTPTCFTELDDLLAEICPKLSYLEYKKINETCVSVSEWEDSDYYSRVTKQCFVCDLESLYNLLCEYGYITDSEQSDAILNSDDLEAIREIAGKDMRDMTPLEKAAWKLFVKSNIIPEE